MAVIDTLGKSLRVIADGKSSERCIERWADIRGKVYQHDQLALSQSIGLREKLRGWSHN